MAPVLLIDTDRDGWKRWGAAKTVPAEGSALRLETDGKNCYVGIKLDGASALKPQTKYRLSYFVRTKDLVSPTGARGGYGACMEVEHYGDKAFGGKYKAVRTPEASYFSGTLDARHQAVEFTTDDWVGKGSYKAMLWLRVFKAQGTAWFDGVRLEEIK